MSTIRVVNGTVTRTTSNPVEGLEVEIWMTWGQAPVNWSTLPNGQMRFLGHARTDANGNFTVRIPVDDRRLVSILRNSRCANDQLQVRVFDRETELTPSGNGVVWDTSSEPYSVSVSIADGPAASTDRVVTGILYRKDRSVRSSASAKLLLKALGTDTDKATVTTTSDGRYTITYTHSGSAPDLYVRFLSGSDLIVGSRVVYCAPDFVRMDVCVPDEAERGATEWMMIHASVSDIISAASTTAKALDADGVMYLAQKTHWPAKKLAAYCAAHRLIDFLTDNFSGVTAFSLVTTEVFYCLLTQGLPASFLSLASSSKETLVGALTGARERHVGFTTGDVGNVADELLARAHEIAATQSTIAGGLAQILDTTSLGSANYEAFYTKWRTKTSISAFWADIETTYTTAVMEDVRKKLRLASLTGRYDKLIIGVDQVYSGWSSVSELAQKTRANWTTVIGTTISGGTYNGQSVGSPAGFTDTEYGDYIFSQLESVFPKARLSSEIIADSSTYPDPSTFLTNNPSFDFDTTRITSAWFASADQTGLSDAAATERTLKELQRLHRVAPEGTRYDTIKELHSKGYTSALSIEKKGRRAFLDDLSGSSTVNAETARAVYARAQQQVAKAAALYLKNGSDLDTVQLATVSNTSKAVEDGADTSAVSDYTSLFGTLNQCECDPCVSLLGPAAYLVDLIGYVDDLGMKDVLMHASTGRRREMGGLEVTCANIDTPLPTIDLVNEVLEYAVDTASTPPTATTLPESELAATPEHRNDTAYGTLASAKYPFALPFHRSLAGIRVYLDHLGVSRSQVLERIPLSAGGLAADDRRAAETLGMTDEGWTYATDTAPSDQWDYWGYGSSGYESFLADVPTYLSRADIDVDLLLDLIELPMWAGSGSPTQIDTTGSYEACDVTTWSLTNLTAAKTQQQMRFLRVMKGSGFSPLELQWVFDALSLGGVDETASKRVGLVKRLVADTGLPVGEILTWFGDLPTRSGRTNRGVAAPSYYEQLFQNPALGDEAIEALTLGPGSPPSELLDPTFDIGSVDPGTPKQADFTNALQAALKITEAELFLLHTEVLGGSTSSPSQGTLANLSTLARYASLAYATGLGVEGVVRLVERSDASPFSAASFDQPLAFLDEAAWFLDSGVAWTEIQWLLDGDDAAASEAWTLVGEASEFLEQLAADLDSQDSSARADAATSALAEFLGVPGAVLSVFLTATGTENMSAGSEASALAEFTAIAGTTVSSGATDTLHRLGKVAWFVEHHALTEDLAQWWLDNAASWGLLQPTALPATTTTTASVDVTKYREWRGLARLLDELRALDNHDGSTEAELLGSVGGSGVSSALLARTQWNSEHFTFLTGSSGFNLATASDWYDWENWRLVRRAFDLIERTGLTPNQLASFTEATPTALASDELRLTVRSRYSESEWVDVIVPLQDQLRRAQRDALVAKLMADNGVDTPNDLFGPLLMDPMIEPCARTSRIRFALSAVQTLVQRTLMNLESSSSPTLTRELAQRWEWMKNYRVWEAAVKVFLWPENWIDPELRPATSPLFDAARDQLTQADLTPERAEDALQAYLEGLHDIARLYPLAFYRHQASDADGEVNTLHVFARTLLQPYQYFWRTQVNDGAWSAWEKVDIGITGSHLLPVLHNRRMHLVWPIMEAASKVDGDGEDAEETKYWKIRLAYSTFWRGKWSTKRESTNVLATLTWNDQYGKYTAPPEYQFVFRVSESADSFSVQVWLRTLTAKASESGESEYDYAAVGGWTYSACLGGFADSTESLPSLSGVPSDAKSFRQGFYKSKDADGVVSLPSTLGEEVQLVSAAGAPSKLWRLVIDHTSSGFLVDDEVSFLGNSDRVFLIRPGVVARPVEVDDDYDLGTFNQDPTDYSVDVPDLQAEEGSNYWDEGNDPGELSSASGIADTLGMEQELSFGGNSALDAASGSSRTMSEVDGGVSVVRTSASSDEFGDVNEYLTTASDPVGNPIGELTDYGGFRFETFYHPWVCTMMAELARLGVDGLLFPDGDGEHGANLLRQAGSTSWFAGNYEISGWVDTPYPVEDIDFSFDGAYSLYNWELFFHLPTLIAKRLGQNLSFQEAQRWLHAVFDPTDQDGGTSDPNRFWKVKPLAADPADPISESAELLSENAESADASARSRLERQIDAWRTDPFEPHAIAALRPSTYQKAVVMQYLDNLVEWGDSLFRHYTMESVNEALQLYIFATQVLGPRPVLVENTSATTVDINTLLDDDLSTFVTLESDAVSAEYTSEYTPSTSPSSNLAVLRLLGTFCAPPNERLLGYWDTVDDRLYKIRNCLTIDGQFQPLALYEPPLDPGALVAAAGAGSSLTTVTLSVNRPPYRFMSMIQRANVLAGTVRSLGQSLLSALEKRDAEALAALRSSHEQSLLDTLRDVKVYAVEDAEQQEAAVVARKAVLEERKQHFDSLLEKGLLTAEKQQLKLLDDSWVLSANASQLQALSAFTYLIPGLVTGFTSLGPNATAKLEPANVIQALTAGLNSVSATLGQQAGLVATAAGNERRTQEWEFQTSQATAELEVLAVEEQAVKARRNAAERDLAAHDRQVEQAREVGEFLEAKFSNEELYDWMVQQLTTLYFQCYQLALSTAQKAETCFQLECESSDTFISGEHYDTLRKGLLAGERLQFELDRLQNGYMDANVRRLSISKTVSLAELDPEALVELRETGEASFTVPEAVFDLDFPGHYRRRIKSVSISVPAVGGGRAQVNGTLALASSRIRESAYQSGTYESQTTSVGVGADSIAFSRGIAENGTFDGTLRDERYLPFEGAGAISDWTVKFTGVYEQFDWQSVADVELRIQYTAIDAGDSSAQATAATTHATSYVQTGVTENSATEELALYVSVKDAFPDEWAAFIADVANNALEFELETSHYPHAYQDQTLTVSSVSIVAHDGATTPSGYSIDLTPPGAGSASTLSLTTSSTFGGQAAIVGHTPSSTNGTGNWKVEDPSTPSIPSTLENLVLLIVFRAT